MKNTVIVAFAALLLALAGNPHVAVGEEHGIDRETVVLRKAVGQGEIVCSTGPNLDAATFLGILRRDSVERCLAFYQLHVDWLRPGATRVRLWSRVLGIAKRQLRNGRFEDIDPSSPKAQERDSILDLALIAGTETVPSRIVLAQRLVPGGAFTLYRIDVSGGGVQQWDSPPAFKWTEYDTNVVSDPQAISLSVLANGRCSAEIISGLKHTIYVQVEGRWDFTEVRQWRETSGLGKGGPEKVTSP